MRSSVSVMLKECNPESSLAYPNYGQTYEDHGRISVLLRALREESPKGFDVDELIQSEYLTSEDRVAQIRWIRRDYPLENNAWGEFQVHRAALGLVSYGVAESLSELQELLKLHLDIQTKYSDTLIESRLIVIGWRPDSGQTAPTPDGHTQILYFNSDTQESLAEFIKSLVVVLEFRRRDRALEGSKKLPLYCAPFERKDFVGLDMESRVNKRRIYGRCQKYIGDLSLLCGSLSEALSHYEAASEVLKSTHDWLWLGNALEGLCVTSTIASSHRKSDIKGILSTNEIISTYEEIVEHYSKYKHAGIIEIETSIKAVHVLKSVKNNLLASEFLQNIVFINLPMNDAEKIERFSALSKLYMDIGFKRKASFFNRVAAMRCVAPQNPVPQWSLCYKLLKETVSGYLLEDLDVQIPRIPTRGWASLQIQILQELVGTSRRMGNIKASIRHMATLIETYFHHLSPKERVDLCTRLGLLLKLYYEKENAEVISDLSIYRIPQVMSFKVQPPSAHQVPIPEAPEANIPEGPFLFTPIASSSSLKKNKRIQWVSSEVGEVELSLFNPLGVELKVTDLRLLFQEKEKSFQFEPYGNTFSLPPFSGPHRISLLGKPIGTGELIIKGYSCSVFGLESKCLLEGCELEGGSESGYQSDNTNNIVIDVLPCLPLMRVILESEKMTNSPPVIYWGESHSFNVILNNIGSKTVDEVQLTSITLSINTSPVSDHSSSVVFGKKRDISGSLTLPCAPGDSLSYDINILFRGRNDVKVNGEVASLKNLTPCSYSEMTLSATFAYLSRGDSHRRSSTEKIDFSLHPSTSAVGADVLPGEEDPGLCYLVLDVRNLTPYEMDLHLEPGKVLVIEPQSDCRIPVSIPKMKAPLEERDEGISEYLRSNTSNLKWVLPDEGNRSGLVTIHQVSLSPAMIKTLTCSPILIDCLEPNTSTEYTSGEPTTFRLSIRNVSVDKRDVDIHRILISSHNAQQKDGFQISHPRRLLNSPLRHNSTLHHEFYVLPLMPGCYEVRAAVEYRVGGSDSISPGGEFDTYFKLIYLNVKG